MTTIKLRRDTSTNWTTVNPTLAEGEVGIETDTNKLKIGDGSTVWTSLDYATYTPDEIDTLLLKKQDLLTAGSGINIRLVYPDQVTNTYKKIDTDNHYSGTAITDLEAQSFTTENGGTSGLVLTGIDGTRDFQVTWVMPVAANTSRPCVCFNPSMLNSYQMPRAGSFAIRRTSATSTTLYFSTTKGGTSYSFNDWGSAEVALSVTSIYMKLVKSSSNFYWYYRLSEADNWTNVRGSETAIPANTTTSSQTTAVYFPLSSNNIPVYFGNATTGTTNPITFDLTTAAFAYTPARDPQLTISTDATVQGTLTAGSNITISGDTISATDTTYTDFTGADSVTGGTSGLVPAPSAGDDDAILCGDGTFKTVDSVLGYTPVNKAGDTMTGQLKVDINGTSDIRTQYIIKDYTLGGTAPSGTITTGFQTLDANGTDFANVGGGLTSTGDSMINMWVNNGTKNTQIYITISQDDTIKTYAPACQDNNSIVTTVAKNKAQNGYYKLGNGLIIQWGYKGNVAPGAEVTLPTAFTSTNYSVVTAARYNGATGAYATGVYDETTTSFKVSKATTGNGYWRWIAIGY